ncbi:hypothetical protein [Clostridium guangxiense]|uniref:hypothetical protein n=1 Tax=Clostridium guangxiense TaxID=1662055 RepID=UPI001E2A99F4|nr:hypothetical protein [Clostridium guangxiense]MCD2345772.1 hypothetical protein [Clostridium guangxiense]
MNSLPVAEKIKGFNKLPLEAQKIFTGFLKNFYAAFEFPQDHEVAKVAIAKEGRGKHTTQFIKATTKNGEWFRVLSPHTWY